MPDKTSPAEPREPAAREASIQWMCVLGHPANNQTPNVMTEWVKRSDAEAYFAELRAKITQLRDAQTCVTCRGFICPPMQCGRCIETAKVPEGMPERPATITLQAKLAASERSLLQAREALALAEKDLLIKNCSVCHGSGEFIDSESGGFLAKCHCWANRVREKDAEIAKLRASTSAPEGTV